MITYQKSLRNLDLSFIDLEMTGLHYDAEIIEIGAVLVERKKYEIEDAFDIKVKPKHLDKASKSSLKVVGFSEDIWKDAINLKEALEILVKKCKNRILIGQNITWDVHWLAKAFGENDMKMPFYYQRLDVLSMSFTKYIGKKKPADFGLNKMCRFFKIEHGREHSALDDAIATYKVFLKLLEK